MIYLHPTFIFLFLLFSSLFVKAQQITVTGSVTDEHGEPLMGVTVQIMGSTSGTVTGADGDFSLAAPADGVIQFSYIGFTSVERPVKADKKAVATLHLLLPDDLGMVERIDGTWNMSGETFTIEGDLIPGMTAKLSFDIKQMSESVMECQMKVDLPLLPPNGIPVVFKKK